MYEERGNLSTRHTYSHPVVKGRVYIWFDLLTRNVSRGVAYKITLVIFIFPGRIYKTKTKVPII